MEGSAFTSCIGANCWVNPLYTGDLIQALVTSKNRLQGDFSQKSKTIKSKLTCWEAFCRFKSGSEDLFRKIFSLFSLGGGSFFRWGLGAWKPHQNVSRHLPWEHTDLRIVIFERSFREFHLFGDSEENHSGIQYLWRFEKKSLRRFDSLGTAFYGTPWI